MGGRSSALLPAALLAAVLAVLGTSMPVPLVALGPGPTYNTLGDVDGAPVVSVDGLATYPTSGHLNMTTVAVSDRLTFVQMLRAWASGDRQVVPRSQIFPPGKTDDQVRAENTQQFATSESNAELAAMTQLAIPTRVVVGAVVPDSPAATTLRVGDELVAVSGREVGTPASVSEALAGTTPGQNVSVTYRRDGQEQTADVALAASPDRTQGLLGVRPSVEPRAGDVSPIGGIPFKMRAARDAGATVFLVPDENCTEAATTAPAGLQLIRVTGLGDAVTQLDVLDGGGQPRSC